jgi:serine/threonine protein kinase
MPADSELVLDLAAEYLEAVRQNRPVDLASVCRARPDLLPQVRETLRHADEVAAVGARAADVSGLPEDDEPMPDALGRYELHHELGRGTFGVAFRGRDPDLNRDVAVKLLRLRWAGQPAAARRFLDEARITAQLQHPSVPSVHEIGGHPDGRPWMAMKLIKGRTLRHLFDTDGVGGHPLAVFEALCQGLSYAHSKGVVHRDLKPENVMVGAFGEVQIMDWGLAKVLSAAPTSGVTTGEETAGTVIAADRASDGTRAGTVVGSPAYMAPEQAIGAVDKIDRRSDVFGLGGILCRLLTGRPPFVAADSESARQLAAMG